MPNKAQIPSWTWNSYLTSACVVHSNVHGLGSIHWIKYFTAVDPFHFTFSAVHLYHHLTSGSIEVPWIPTGNSSATGKEPVSWRIFSIRRSATSSQVCHAKQGNILFTNVLQGHETVVLVCCTIQWEQDITCMQKVRDSKVIMFVYWKFQKKGLGYSKLI